MSKWKEFENESARYLREKYGEYADFEGKGKSDSSVSDIEVVCKNKKDFLLRRSVALHNAVSLFCSQIIRRKHLNIVKEICCR